MKWVLFAAILAFCANHSTCSAKVLQGKSATSPQSTTSIPCADAIKTLDVTATVPRQAEVKFDLAQCALDMGAVTLQVIVRCPQAEATNFPTYNLTHICQTKTSCSYNETNVFSCTGCEFNFQLRDLNSNVGQQVTKSAVMKDEEPGAPLNLFMGRDSSSSRIHVEWNPPYKTQACAWAYEAICVSEDGIVYTNNNVATADTEWILDNDITPCTSYNFSVAAIDKYGNTGPNATLDAMTPEEVPGAPRQLRASPGTPLGVAVVHWEPPSTASRCVSHYSAEVLQNNGSVHSKCQTPHLDFSVDGLQPGDQYTVQVRAITQNQVKAPSTTIGFVYNPQNDSSTENPSSSTHGSATSLFATMHMIAACFLITLLHVGCNLCLA